MSPTLLARCVSTERRIQRDRMALTRSYRASGMSAREVTYYSARVAWSDAVSTVQRDHARTS